MSGTPGSDPAASTDDESLGEKPEEKQATGPDTGVLGEAADRPVRLDVEALGRSLLGTWADIRVEARKLAAREDMQRIEGQPMEEHRARVFEQLGKLVEHGQVLRAFPKRLGGGDDAGGNIAGFEELVLADPSLQIKSGVQWGLFGAAVLHLGTEKHHDAFLPGIMDLSVPGAFAMTEIGHGSDVASLGTTATYDETTQEFVIDTPFYGAWKEFLGNAARDGVAATVFAQLITKGVNHGVHCFYVPIRDEKGEFLPGVGGEDDGLKGGLNGIDNGRLHFTGVRIPRDNLLNRYGDVAEDGTYSSPIESPGRRFFTMLGTLVQGRVSLDGAATTASALGLTIALRYAEQRRQFNAGSDTDEEVLLDYQLHQRRLLPLLAQTYAQTFAHDRLLRQFDDVFSGRGDSDDDRQELETLAAALKPLSTWNALDTLQECREACGGAGFMTSNRFTSLRADLDVYATFEGDNHVLLQLVAKRLLTDYSKRFRGAGPGVLARYVVEQATDRAIHGSGLRRLAQLLHDGGSAARSASRLRDTDTQRALLTDRVETMVEQIGQALRPASGLSKQQGADLFNSQQAALIEAARGHGELLQWEAFTEAVEATRDAATRTVLTRLRDLFGLTLLERHLDWYLVNGRLSSQRAQAVTETINRLLARLRPYAAQLVDAFGFDEAHLRAPIATDGEQQRQDAARAHAAAQRASADAPVDEKALRAAEKARKKAQGKKAQEKKAQEKKAQESTGRTGRKR